MPATKTGLKKERSDHEKAGYEVFAGRLHLLLINNDGYFVDRE